MKLIVDHTKSKVELYDLSKDLRETHNTASYNTDTVEKLLQELKQNSPCHDKKGLFPVYSPYKQKMINRSCKFFKKKSIRKLCWKYPKACLHCGWACAKKEKRVEVNADRLEPAFEDM